MRKGIEEKALDDKGRAQGAPRAGSQMTRVLSESITVTESLSLLLLCMKSKSKIMDTPHGRCFQLVFSEQ